MEVELLNAKQVGQKLNELLDECESFYCAVAWATDMVFAKKLLNEKNRNKIKNFIVGIDFAQTSYGFLKKLQTIENVRYMPNNGGKTFHPKIYYFVNNDEAFAIIGSSNCTKGGLSNNEETSLLIQGKKNQVVFKEIFEKIEHWFDDGRAITDDFLEKYKKIQKSTDRLKEQRNELSSELEKLSHFPTITEVNIDELPRIHIAWWDDEKLSKCNNFLDKDKEILKEDWVLNWACDKEGKPLEVDLKWFKIDKIENNNCRNHNYKITAEQKKCTELPPFYLNEKTQKIIKKLLKNNDIFFDYDNWKCPKQEEVKKFLHHLQEEYKKEISKLAD
ncbi:MAG: phospholipase D family protein [Methylococcaceae bacterium]